MATLRNKNFCSDTKSLSLRDFQLLEILTADILREPRTADAITRFVDDREIGNTTLRRELSYLRDLVRDITDINERLAKVSGLQTNSSPSRAVFVDTARRLAQKRG